MPYPRNAHEQTIGTVVETLRQSWASVLKAGTPVALIDYPNHNNCGDSAIWLGERRLLEALGADIRVVCDISGYNPAEIARHPEIETILLHGGGNFGSIWPRSQALREQVITDHPYHSIVQLPQTIWYATEEEADRTRDVLAQHGDVTLFVRDEISRNVAKTALGVEPLLSPDAAFALGPLTTRRDALVDIVWMARTDGEGTVRPPESRLDDVIVVDWLRGSPYDPLALQRARVTVRMRRLYQASQRSAMLRRGLRGRMWMFDFLAQRRLQRGIDILSSGRVVVTDRLHGHILCTLLGKRHVVLDTAHGKVSSYIAAHRPPAGLLAFANSSEEALEIARKMVKDGGGSE